jgi:hypothetical protein
VSPYNENKLYILGVSAMESTDGVRHGKILIKIMSIQIIMLCG